MNIIVLNQVRNAKCRQIEFYANEDGTMTSNDFCNKTCSSTSDTHSCDFRNARNQMNSSIRFNELMCRCEFVGRVVVWAIKTKQNMIIRFSTPLSIFIHSETCLLPGNIFHNTFYQIINSKSISGILGMCLSYFTGMNIITSESVLNCLSNISHALTRVTSFQE